MRNLLTLLVLITLPLAARADWTLTTADFSDRKNLTLNTWSAAEGLSVTDSSGKLQFYPTRDIALLKSDRTPAPARADWLLTLRNGDRLLGEPVTISGQSLVFNVTSLGKLNIPLKNLAFLIAQNLPAAPLPEPSADKDIVRFKNKDSFAGILLSLDPAKVEVAAENNNATPFDMKLVSAIAFGGLTPPQSVPPLSARIALASGSILTVPADASFSLTINTLKCHDPAGQDLSVSLDQVLSVEVLGGRIVWLTELDPASTQLSSFMGTKWPIQINKNVLAQPLTVAKRTFDRGIGVHVTTVLTYDLTTLNSGGGTPFTQLRIRPAMDDSAAPSGEAHLAIVLDGKTLWENPAAKPTPAGGQPPEILTLDISHGKTLELRATPAARLDIQSRANWLDPALLRP